MEIPELLAQKSFTNMFQTLHLFNDDRTELTGFVWGAMSRRNGRIFFAFDVDSYRQARRRLPPLLFTCSDLAKTALPPYLKFCLRFLEYLKLRPDTLPFHNPVPDDPHAAPEYYVIIKNPMDFSTMQKKVLHEDYPDLASFKADLDLIWANCTLYNGLGSELHRRGNRVKCDCDELWSLHSTISDPTDAMKFLSTLVAALKICTEDLTVSNPRMQLFRVTEHLKVKKPQIDRIRPIGKIEKEKEDRNTFSLPSEDMLNAPLSNGVRYDLATAIDQLPPELLGEVIDILSKNVEISKDKETEIPFSSLDTPVLRTIEAYVAYAGKKEQNVRRMYQSDQISAAEQLQILTAELDRVKKLLSEKHPHTSSSECTSENDMSEEESTGGDSGGSMSSDADDDD
jgi:hypothetical protein